MDDTVKAERDKLSKSALRPEWRKCWRTCREVLSRRDIEKRLGERW